MKSTRAPPPPSSPPSSGGQTCFRSSARRRRRAAGAIPVETSIGPVLVNADANRQIVPGDSIVIRPEDLQISAQAPPAGRGNVFHGRVRRPVFLGENVELEIEIRGEILMSRQHSRFAVRGGRRGPCRAAGRPLRRRVRRRGRGRVSHSRRTAEHAERTKHSR